MPKGQPKGVPRDRAQAQPKGGKGGARELCNKFNQGRCADPCPHGRKHACAVCGKGGHGMHSCPQGDKAEKDAER